VLKRAHNKPGPACNLLEVVPEADTGEWAQHIQSSPEITDKIRKSQTEPFALEKQVRTVPIPGIYL